jgi:enoyl-CoA hydratase/carnithine racemase
MSVELARLVTECNSDTEVRVVILTGAGTKAFCAGSDVRELDITTRPGHFGTGLNTATLSELCGSP